MENGTDLEALARTLLTANENDDYAYTLSEAGDYSYSVAFGADSDYNDIPETGFTVGEDETAKTIAVPLTYKTTEPSGDGTGGISHPHRHGGGAARLCQQGKQRRLRSGTRLHQAHGQYHRSRLVDAARQKRGFPVQRPTLTATITASPSRMDNPNLTYFGFFGCLDSKVDRDSTTPIDEQPTVVVKKSDGQRQHLLRLSQALLWAASRRLAPGAKVSIENCVNNATVSSLARQRGRGRSGRRL